MVRVISISDEVYLELSQRKNGKSFTETIKMLLEECPKKGDAKTILEFLKTHEPLSEEEAESLTKASEEARKNATPRKSASFE
jgi:predicted CopG family antitoxin